MRESGEREGSPPSVGGQTAACSSDSTGHRGVLPGGQSFRCEGVPTACAPYTSVEGDAREEGGLQIINDPQSGAEAPLCRRTSRPAQTRKSGKIRRQKEASQPARARRNCSLLLCPTPKRLLEVPGEKSCCPRGLR